MPLVFWSRVHWICKLPWIYNHFNNIDSSNPSRQYTFPSICVVFIFFHLRLIVFGMQNFCFIQFSSVQFSRCRVWLFATPWIAARQASLSITNSWSYSNSCPLSRWCHPAISSSVVPFSSCPQSPPSIRVFANESTLRVRWPKYWSFSFIISPSNEYPGLISFRMDRLDLLAVQGTLKNLLHHHSSKASILWHSAFFTVQLSHPSMTTGKTI